jgi:hypothetical protein
MRDEANTSTYPCRAGRGLVVPDNYTLIPPDQPASLADLIDPLAAGAGGRPASDARHGAVSGR